MCQCDRDGESLRKLQPHKAYAQRRDNWAKHETETKKQAKDRSHPTATGSKHQHVDQSEAGAIPEMVCPACDIRLQRRPKGELISSSTPIRRGRFPGMKPRRKPGNRIASRAIVAIVPAAKPAKLIFPTESP